MLNHRYTDTLLLCATASTWVCCVLPALFVSVGAGASLAALVAHVPQLVWLSKHKLLLFTIAGAGLCMGLYAQQRARHLPCPVDPALAQACLKLRRRSRIVFGISVVLYAVGALMAFVLPYV